MDVGMGDLLIRLVGSLAVVVGILFLIARAVNRRYAAPSGAAVQVVQRQALTRGSGVAVITVGTRVLVVGTTEQQVTLLAELDPDELEMSLDKLDHQEIHESEPRDGRVATASTNALSGSLLSAATWKQTVAALRRTPTP